MAPQASERFVNRTLLPAEIADTAKDEFLRRLIEEDGCLTDQDRIRFSSQAWVEDDLEALTNEMRSRIVLMREASGLAFPAFVPGYAQVPTRQDADCFKTDDDVRPHSSMFHQSRNHNLPI